LISCRSVEENISISSLPHYCRFGMISKPKLFRRVRELVQKLAIKTPALKQAVMYLSGGNQQKVVLAKWLASQPKILILDEPTRGIDVGSKAEVHALISKLAQSGIGIILISSELPEILGMSDRIVVMHEGGVAAILDRSEATQELIMAYASGTEKNNKKEQSSK